MPEPVMSAPAAVAGRVTEGICRIAEAGPLGMVALKADLSDPLVIDAVRAVSGVEVPPPLSCRLDDDRAVVWMAPDELLVLLPRDRAADAVGTLRETLAARHHLALDVSAARVVFRLTGRDAGEVLAKGAPLDFRDGAFPVGAARRTHLGQVAALIWREGPEAWSLACFRSVAEHVADWLGATAAPGSRVGHF